MEQPDPRPAPHVAALYWAILLLDVFTSRCHRLLDRIARLRSREAAVQVAQPQSDGAEKAAGAGFPSQTANG